MSHAGLVNGAFLTMGGLLLATAGSIVRRPGATPARVALTASLGSLGVSFLVQSPWGRRLQEDIAVNLGQLTGNALTLVAAYAMQVMMLRVLHEPARASTLARRWAVALGAAVAALTACFVMTPSTPGRFTSPDAPSAVLAYYVVYCGYLGCTLTALTLLLRRYAERTSDRWLRLSLRLYGWACLVAMCYLVGRIGNLVVGRLWPTMVASGDRYGLLEFLVAAVVPGISLLLVLTAGIIRAAGRRADYRRADRRLRPLWEAIRAARPQAVLPVSRRVGARLRLYRRVIEIQDGQLAAAHHVSAALLASINAAVAAAGLTGDNARTTRAAAILAAGLAAMARDRTVVEPQPEAALTSTAEHADLATLVQFLSQVTDAFVDSPVVREFADDVSVQR